MFKYLNFFLNSLLIYIVIHAKVTLTVWKKKLWICNTWIESASYNGFVWNSKCFHESYLKLDWANSAPTYPQTGHHSRHRFWSGIFKNIITHYYMNFSTSIYSVYIFQGRWCIPRRRIHNSNYIFNLPAMITLNLFSKYLNDWWLNVHSKIIIPKEHICFYICWQIKYYF